MCENLCFDSTESEEKKKPPNGGPSQCISTETILIMGLLSTKTRKFQSHLECFHAKCPPNKNGIKSTSKFFETLNGFFFQPFWAVPATGQIFTLIVPPSTAVLSNVTF